MSFPSVLFDRPEKIQELDPPGFFVDLNLDQIVANITAGKDEYNLKPFFYFSLNHTDAIEYRHEVMQDLENPTLLECVKSFAQKMRAIREYLAQADKLYYKYQKESWFLDAVELYCDAVACFADDLSIAALKSRGFLAFRKYLADYSCSTRFTSLLANANKLKDELSKIRYCVIIKGDSFQVRKYEFESDYSVDVEETFEKFKQGAVNDYRVKFSNRIEMNHIEAQIVDFVAQLHPDTFSSLDDYYLKNRDFLDEAVAVFDREIQFYVAYIEYISKLKRAGLKFCYPRVSNESKEICNYEGFDLALADKLIGERSPIVCNDFFMKDKERIFIVTGPNQGGKTTFARTFGQLHYLAGLGCPVPGRDAQLFLFDRLFTHFEREEDIQNLRGKLHDDLVRIHDIISQATSNSIIIMNEIFTSTTLQDAIFLSKKMMKKIKEFDLLCVWVTFIDELAHCGERVVSLVSSILPENPTLRTFKILRKPADGLSYAMSLAEKYRLTYKSLKERV